MDKPSHRLPIALLALAVGGFGIGCAEFTIMGLLPEVAAGVDVSIPDAGHLVSAYAIGVVIGAPLLSLAAGRIERRLFLMLLMAMLAAGSAMAAMAPNYEVLLGARVLTGLPHGAFFGVGAVVAARAVVPRLRGAAIATMFTGLAFANVIGVPAGTWLGQNLGWEAAFWAAAVVGGVAVVSVFAFLPRMKPSGAGIGPELEVFRQPRVWLALASTAVGFGGVVAVLGYVTPLMVEEGGFASGSMTWLLVIVGVGMVCGTQLAGLLMRRYGALRLVHVLLALLALNLLAFSVLTPVQPVAIVLLFCLGVISFAVGTPLQALIIAQSGTAPTLASAANQAGFNLGNAIGPAAAGLAIAGGLGVAAVGWVGAIITTLGLLLALLLAAFGGHGLSMDDENPVGADEAGDRRQQGD